MDILTSKRTTTNTQLVQKTHYETDSIIKESFFRS